MTGALVAGEAALAVPAPAAPGKKDAELRSALWWLGSTSLIWQALSWGFTLLTVRLLTPADYGLIALAETLVPYLAILASCNIGTWLIQAAAIERHESEAALGLSTCLGAAIMILCFLVAPLAASFYSAPALRAPLQLLSLCFLFEGLQVIPRATLRRKMRFKELAISNLSISILRSLLQLVLAFYGFAYMALVYGVLFKSIAETISFHILEPVRPLFAWRPDLYRRILSYSLPASAPALCWIVFSTADNAIIGLLFGAEALGYYAIAYYLSDMPISKLSSIVKPVAFSHLSRLKDDPSEQQREFLKFLSRSLIIIWPLLAAMSVSAFAAIPVILGQAWQPAAAAFSVLSIAGMARVITDNVSVLLLASGKADKDLSINLASATLMPLAFWVSGSLYGIQGVYFSWLCVFPLVTIFSLHTLRSAIPVTYRALGQAIFPALSSSLLAGGLVWLCLGATKVL